MEPYYSKITTVIEDIVEKRIHRVLTIYAVPVTPDMWQWETKFWFVIQIDALKFSSLFTKHEGISNFVFTTALYLHLYLLMCLESDKKYPCSHTTSTGPNWLGINEIMIRDIEFYFRIWRAYNRGQVREPAMSGKEWDACKARFGRCYRLKAKLSMIQEAKTERMNAAWNRWCHPDYLSQCQEQWPLKVRRPGICSGRCWEWEWKWRDIQKNPVRWDKQW